MIKLNNMKRPINDPEVKIIRGKYIMFSVRYGNVDFVILRRFPPQPFPPSSCPDQSVHPRPSSRSVIPD